jgi:hypothetical protein
MGFAHKLNFSEDDTITTNNIETSPIKEMVISFLWIVSYALLLAAAIFLILYMPYWWMAATAGVLLSEILVFLYWQEAKYVSIANIIIMLAAISFIWQQGF